MPTLAIVSPDDRPVFEATFPQAFAGKHVVVEQLVLHSSLDMVDEKVRFSLRFRMHLHRISVLQGN